MTCNFPGCTDAGISAAAATLPDEHDEWSMAVILILDFGHLKNAKSNIFREGNQKDDDPSLSPFPSWWLGIAVISADFKDPS